MTTRQIEKALQLIDAMAREGFRVESVAVVNDAEVIGHAPADLQFPTLAAFKSHLEDTELDRYARPFDQNEDESIIIDFKPQVQTYFDVVDEAFIRVAEAFNMTVNCEHDIYVTSAWNLEFHIEAYLWRRK